MFDVRTVQVVVFYDHLVDVKKVVVYAVAQSSLPKLGVLNSSLDRRDELVHMVSL